MVLGEKIAIWGTGSLARKIYALYCDKVDVVCFYDSDESKVGQTIGNAKVKKWTGDCEYRIVIASTYWREIATKLNETEFVKNGGTYILSAVYFKNTSWLSYSDLKDFFEISKCGDYTSFIGNEKIVVLYGNCQISIIEGIIKLYTDFTKDYMIVNVPKVYEWIYDKEKMSQFLTDNLFWKSVDLFIYQTVSDDNKFSPLLATNKILKNLKSDCTRVNILNLYYKGYFPQIDVKNENLLMTAVRPTGLFTFRDRYVDILLKKGGMNADKIIEMISNLDFINEDEISENAKASMEELENREKSVDVKIVDYIKAHISDEQLFYSFNHPNENLLVEYVNRIMEYLGYTRTKIQPKDVVLSVGTLKAEDMPLYPSVIKYFNLKKYDNRLYINRSIYPDMLLDFEQYMRIYIEIIQKENILNNI